MITSLKQRKFTVNCLLKEVSFYLLDFVCSDIQFYVLLSPYLFFISFLYLDLYAFRDDAWISKGSFMQTKHLYVLIHN